MIIAFSGSSGSGKSTLLKEASKLVFFKRTKLILKDEDDFFSVKVYSKVFKFLFGFRKLETVKSDLKLNRVSRAGKFFSNIIPFLYAISVYTEFVFYYLRYEILQKNVVFLQDRYIYDYLLTLNQNMDFSNRFINYIFDKFPEPYLIFFVDIDRETAIERNISNALWVEHSLKREDWHKKMIEKYRDFFLKKRNAIRIDNRMQLQNAVENVKEKIIIKSRLASIKKLVIFGLDGTGKTSLAKRIKDYYMEFGMKAEILHFYHRPLLYKLLVFCGILEDAAESDEHYQKSRLKAMEINERGKSFIWGALHFFDFYIQYLTAILFFRNQVVIFDRFFYDFIVSFQFYKIKNYKLFEYFIPFVKNKLCLICEPEISFKRKPENTLDFFIFCQRAYAEMVEKHRMPVIDTTNISVDETFCLFIDKIKNEEI